MGPLSRAFNRMTSQIERQRDELVEANRQLEERRRFTEAVLAGVSAGVIGLDEQARINLPNRSASELLAVDLVDAHRPSPIAEIVPEMAPLVEAAAAAPVLDRRSRRSISSAARETRTLLVRIVAESWPRA